MGIFFKDKEKTYPENVTGDTLYAFRAADGNDSAFEYLANFDVAPELSLFLFLLADKYGFSRTESSSLSTVYFENLELDVCLEKNRKIIDSGKCCEGCGDEYLNTLNESENAALNNVTNCAC